MKRPYSQLKRVLDGRNMTVPELHRRIERAGLHVNLKSLYRLTREAAPLERLDLRVAGVICQVCGVTLSELIAFADEKKKIARLSVAKQRRLDELMDQNNDGRLTAAERSELRQLVEEAQRITVDNARILAAARRRLPTG
jgi:hypothetical protein